MNAADLEKMNAQAEKFRRLFDLVANPSDWRGPIDVAIDAGVFVALNTTDAEVADAVEFMTGTRPSFDCGWRHGRPIVRVRAIGYRAGPCGG